TEAANELPRRQFGQTEIWVPPLCMGCAPLVGMPGVFGYDVSEAQALATVCALLDSPIRYLDTAGAYGAGESERRIGMVLHERGGLPAGSVLQTKVGRNH